MIYIFRNTEFTFRQIYKCKFGSRQFQAILISESGCCTTNVKLVNSADPFERRPKVASHRGLSCLLTINRRPIGKIFSLFLIQTYVVGTQKNRLNETVLLSTQNTCSSKHMVWILKRTVSMRRFF